MKNQVGDKRTRVFAVCNRLGELVPFMEEEDCDGFLGLAKTLNQHVKEIRARLETDAGVAQMSLDDILDPPSPAASSPPPPASSPPSPQRHARVASPELPSKKRAVPNQEKEKEDDGEGEEEEEEEWDPVKHAIIRHVLMQVDTGIIVMAKADVNPKGRTTRVHIPFDKVSDTNNRQWSFLASFFEQDGLPPQLDNTAFGNYFYASK